MSLQAYKERSAAKDVLPGEFIHHLFSYSRIEQITSIDVQEKKVMLFICNCLAGK